VSNPDQSLLRCPKCHRKVRLRDHSDKQAVAAHRQSPANSAEGRATPPPLPSAASTPAAKAQPLPVQPPALPTLAPTPAAKPKASAHLGQASCPRRRKGNYKALITLAVWLFSACLVGGAITWAYLVAPPDLTPEPAPKKQVAAVAPPRVEKPKAPVVTAPRPAPRETPQERAMKALYQSEEVTTNFKTLDAARKIDDLVLTALKAKEIPQSPVCSDSVFVRRVYLDVIGRIPTAEEAKEFLNSKDPNRRRALIDALLEHGDFADYWTMKWCDLLRVKSEFPINLWPNAVQAYHRWIRTAMRDNMPYDVFARQLLTASGSNFRDPPANFYRAVQKKDAPTISKAVALTFMGVRPEGWTKERWQGMEPFFSQLGYKPTREWKEEIVFFDPNKPLKTAQAVFPDGTQPIFENDQDPREVFTNWLISEKNPWFTRNIANRAWSWLLGRGIIHEVDDIRDDNPPSIPELLSYLEEELVAAKYDLRQLFRVILNSRTYQASSIPASKHAEAPALFAHYPVRRLEAEVMIDIICQVTQTTEKYSSPIPEPFTYIPESHRTVALADASITSSFLEIFGRSSRDTGLESERNNQFTAAQRLHLLNSTHIGQKLQNGPGLQQILRSGGKPAEIADKLFLTLLSRYPSEEEREILAEYTTPGVGRRPGLDFAWALMNTAEFLCRH
jgi:hypothetical protein